MESVINLMWEVEDEKVNDEIEQSRKNGASLEANCGTSACCCCCSVPNVFTKWICT